MNVNLMGAIMTAQNACVTCLVIAYAADKGTEIRKRSIDIASEIAACAQAEDKVLWSEDEYNQICIKAEELMLSGPSSFADWLMAVSNGSIDEGALRVLKSDSADFHTTPGHA